MTELQLITLKYIAGWLITGYVVIVLIMIGEKLLDGWKFIRGGK